MAPYALVIGAVFSVGALSACAPSPVQTSSTSETATATAEVTAGTATAAEEGPAAEQEVTSIIGSTGAVCGEASWYGDELRGNPTASGEPFDPDGLTAAHRTLPLGSVILVEWEGAQVELRINDRGPFAGDRILDLSRGAADQLGYTDLGTADLCYVVVSDA